MSLARPFYSVVIPLYNKEPYIGTTLRSVLNQTDKDFEVLVIDDGSTDKGLEVLKPYCDSRLKLFSKENGGVSSARNYGIARAQGEFVAFLDADDTWSPCYLAKMKNLIERYPNNGLYIAAHYVVERNKEYTVGETIPEGVLDDLFKTELEMHIIRISATVAPTSILKGVGGFPVGMVSGEDAFLCASIALRHKIVFTPELLVTYFNIFSGKELRYDKIDTCRESWYDLYEEGNYYKNEFVAVKAIKAGIRSALGGRKDRSIHLERATSYTTFARQEWLYLYFLNRLPYSIIKYYKKIRPIFNRIRAVLLQILALCFASQAIDLFTSTRTIS